MYQTKNRILLFFSCVMLLLCACSANNETSIVESNQGNYPLTDSTNNEEPKTDDSITIVGPTGMEPYYIAIENTTDLYGIYDVMNEGWILEPTLLFIDTYDSAGMAMAQQGDYYGYIDQEGNTVIGFQFGEAQSFNERNFAPVRMNHFGVIDRMGNFIIEPMYDGISYNSDFIKVYNGKYGLYDHEGNLIIAPEYDNDFIFDDQFIYTKAYHNNYGDWYFLFDYTGDPKLDSLKWAITEDKNLFSEIGRGEIVEGVSIIQEGVLICDYCDSGRYESYYRLFDENLSLIIEQDYAFISPFNSFGYAAALPCDFARKVNALSKINDGNWIVIDTKGNVIADLPDMTGDSHVDIGYHGWRYLYANGYYAYAKWDGEALVNIATGDITRWEAIEPFDGTYCIIAQNESTGLWTLFDRDNIVDSTCTDIIFDGEAFQLIHGGESKTYIPMDRK